MSEQDKSVLGYFRAREPRFNEVPDEQLTLYVGTRHPEFLQDEEFRNEFGIAATAKFLQQDAPRLALGAQSVAAIGAAGSKLKLGDRESKETSISSLLQEEEPPVDSLEEARDALAGSVERDITGTPPVDYNVSAQLASTPGAYDELPEPKPDMLDRAAMKLSGVYDALGRITGGLQKAVQVAASSTDVSTLAARGPEAVLPIAGALFATGVHEKAWEKTVEDSSLPKKLFFKATGGLAESAPRMAASMGLTFLGVPAPAAMAIAFAPNAEGVTAKDIAVAASLPLAGRIGGGVANKVSSALGITKPQAVGVIHAFGAGGGITAVMGAEQAIAISKLPVEQMPDAVIDAVASNIGNMAAALGGVVFMKDAGKRRGRFLSWPARIARQW